MSLPHRYQGNSSTGMSSCALRTVIYSSIALVYPLQQMETSLIWDLRPKQKKKKKKKKKTMTMQMAACRNHKASPTVMIEEVKAL